MEVRKLVIGAELRAAGDFAIVGKALSYNVLSPTGSLGPGTAERIAPGAFADSIKNGEDVKCLVNHNADNLLGRIKSGTLALTDGTDALRFRVQLDKNSQAHRDTYSAVQRGDWSECSFSFTVEDQDWKPGVDGKGEVIQIRTVKKGKLYDVSLVTFPFYSEGNATSAEARARADADAADANKSHGMIEALKKYRQAAQSFVRAAFRRSDSGGTDFASHLSRCHEEAELMCMMAQRCESAMGDDEDVDDEDRVLRSAFIQAHVSCTMAAEKFATARLRHQANLSKKQQAKALGRGR
jgi:HK97 family phage prohead protease